MAHSRLSTILHKSSAARVGMDQPRFRQISNIARKILHKRDRVKYISTVLSPTYRPADCCTKTMSATSAKPESRIRQWSNPISHYIPSSLSCEIYAWSKTLIFAAGSSTDSLTGIGTFSSSFPSSTFSYSMKMQWVTGQQWVQNTYILSHRYEFELIRQCKHPE